MRRHACGYYIDSYATRKPRTRSSQSPGRRGRPSALSGHMHPPDYEPRGVRSIRDPLQFGERQQQHWWQRLQWSRPALRSSSDSLSASNSCLPSQTSDIRGRPDAKLVRCTTRPRSCCSGNAIPSRYASQLHQLLQLVYGHISVSA